MSLCGRLTASIQPGFIWVSSCILFQTNKRSSLNISPKALVSGRTCRHNKYNFLKWLRATSHHVCSSSLRASFLLLEFDTFSPFGIFWNSASISAYCSHCNTVQWKYRRAQWRAKKNGLDGAILDTGRGPYVPVVSSPKLLS